MVEWSTCSKKVVGMLLRLLSWGEGHRVPLKAWQKAKAKGREERELLGLLPWLFWLGRSGKKSLCT